MWVMAPPLAPPLSLPNCSASVIHCLSSEATPTETGVPVQVELLVQITAKQVVD